MSFLSSIFPSASGTPVNSGVPQNAAPATPLGPVPTVTPAPAAAPATPAAPASPLDQFATLWQTPLAADGKPAPVPQNTLAQPIFNFDPAAITASAAKMDFTSSIAPETIQKALSGDAGAFSDAINAAVRQAVVGMTMSQGNLINQAVVANNQRVTDSLPTHIKSVQLMDQENSNPVFSHPAAQPLVQSLKKMAFAKDPNASPAAIDKQISEYLMSFASAITEASPENKQKVATAAAGEQDWSSFL